MVRPSKGPSMAVKGTASSGQRSSPGPWARPANVPFEEMQTLVLLCFAGSQVSCPWPSRGLSKSWCDFLGPESQLFVLVCPANVRPRDSCGLT